MNLSRFLTIEGDTRSIKAWSREPGAAAYHTIWWRLKKGIEAKAAVFAPAHSKAAIAGAPDDPLPVYRPRKRRARTTPILDTTFRPIVGSFKSVPIEMLDTIRRLA